MSEYISNIGLEIHVQLNTESKAFSSESQAFGGEANTRVSAISLALPGTLPKLNKLQMRHAIKLGLACGCAINTRTTFDRKNYTYPDLPKAYQITQDKAPVCIGGRFSYYSEGKKKSIRLHHIHMEEDAGKSIHDQDADYSMIDLNRAGTPLVEVVTEPDFETAIEVYDFIDAFQVLLRHLDVSDANMEEGSLRADCNVSIRKKGETELGTRTETKNLNSKRFARQAIEFEIKRQSRILQNGGRVEQETRLFDPNSGETYVMRSKEDALDYRYFPEPDLPDFYISAKDVDLIGKEIGKLPFELQEDLIEHHGIDQAKAAVLSRNPAYSSLFSHIVQITNDSSSAADLIVNHGKSISLETLDDMTLLSRQMADMIQLIKVGKLSASTAYKSIVPLLDGNQDLDVESLARDEGLLITKSANEDEALCTSILEQFPDKTTAYRKGKKGLIGFFMGQFMRQSQTASNPADVQKIFEKLLNSDSD